MVTMTKNQGKLFIISGPSGVGKGTVLSYFLANCKHDVCCSISTTTRAPRAGEINGKHYFFISRDEFIADIQQGAFLEYAEYAGNFYGTHRETVFEQINRGISSILEIETQGAQNIIAQYPDTVSIFFLPPSLDILAERLRGRNTETEEVIQRRLAMAKHEIELSKIYKHKLINYNSADTAIELAQIFDAELSQ